MAWDLNTDATEGLGHLCVVFKQPFSDFPSARTMINNSGGETFKNQMSGPRSQRFSVSRSHAGARTLYF